MEAAAWIDRVNNVKYTGLYFSGDNNAHVNPATLVEQLARWRPVPGNNSGWKNDQWTQLVTALATEPDPAKQKVLIPQMNDFVLDQSWIFPISSNPAILVTAHNGSRGWCPRCTTAGSSTARRWVKCCVS